MINFQKYSDLKLSAPLQQLLYIKEGYLIKELYQKDLITNKTQYYQFYYNLTDNTEQDITNNIMISNKSGKTDMNPQLIADFNRVNYQNIISKKFGFMPPDVRGMSLANIPKEGEWYYTEKTDGYNCFIQIGNKVYQAEYLKGIYYIFDVILNNSLVDRLKYIKDNLQNNKYIHIKEFFKVESFEIKYLQNLLKKHWSEQTDGIIFSKNDKDYQDQIHLKLKPRELITNDYLYIWDKAKKEYHIQVMGNKVQFLQSNATQYYKIPEKEGFRLFDFNIPYIVDNNVSYIIKVDKALEYMPSKLRKQFKEGKFHRKIIETAYTDNMIGYPIKIREDKIYPNGLQTCLSNFENRLCPIDTFTDYGYFNVKKTEELEKKYKDFTDFGNNARKIALKQVLELGKDIKTVFDFGSGRGVNYHLLYNYNILSLEPDKLAWIEQYKRIRTIQQQKKTHINTFLIFDYDSLDYIQQNYKYELFISDYSIHYMLGNYQNVRTVMQLMEQAKYIQLLYYSGKRIFELLSKHNFNYTTDKYHIESKKISELKEYGQKIKILLPTISQELTEEYLVNIDYIIDQIKPKDIKFIKFITTDEYLQLIEAVILIQ